MDYTYLLEDTQKRIKAELLIEPLAPLSMCANMPGKIFRSAGEPAESMLLGMLENMLGIHSFILSGDKYFNKSRQKMSGYLKKYHKKHYRNDLSFKEYSSYYLPLIQHHIKCMLKEKPVGDKRHFDLFSQRLGRLDSYLRSHKSYRNTPRKLLQELDEKYDFDQKNMSQEEYKIYMQKVPAFYTSPTLREFIVYPAGSYFRYDIEVTPGLGEELVKRAEDPVSCPFLGTSEGWVDVSFKISEP